VLGLIITVLAPALFERTTPAVGVGFFVVIMYIFYPRSAKYFKQSSLFPFSYKTYKCSFYTQKRVLDDVAVDFRKSFDIKLFFSAISKEIRCEECHLLIG